jgi:hypothetical protein
MGALHAVLLHMVAMCGCLLCDSKTRVGCVGGRAACLCLGLTELISQVNAGALAGVSIATPNNQ